MAFRRETTTSTTSTPRSAREAFGQLGALAGLDAKTVQGTLPINTASERDFFFAALATCRPWLATLSPKLGGGSLLGQLLSDQPFDGELETRALPKDAKKAIKLGEIVANSDADVWIMVERPDGAVQVSRAHPEGFHVLGESLAEWLNAEIEGVNARGATKRPKKTMSGKQQIDDVLGRLLVIATATDASARLATLKQGRNDTLWRYFRQALAACGAVWSPAVLDPLDGRLLGRLLSGKADDDDRETGEVAEGDEPPAGVNPVYVHRYPKEARKVLAQARVFVASSGPEVWFLLWEASGSPMTWAISVHHASYEGYEALGTLEEWLTRELDRVEAAVAGAKGT